LKRQIVYPGAIPLESDLLNTNKNTMGAIGKLIAAVFGTTTFASGLACVPTAPASLSVSVGAGDIYSLQNIDSTAYSSLAADTTHQIMKQGIQLDAVALSCAAPTTSGNSIAYLIQAAYSEVDAGATVLPYYNATTPSQAYSGPNNAGTTNNTTRDGTVVLSAKAGVSATTGSQVTPTPDSGYAGLWVVTVAYGQTTIAASNIAQYASAPFVGQAALLNMLNAFTVSPTAPTPTQLDNTAKLATTAFVSGVGGAIGDARNMAMTLTAASATATFTADEIVVGTALGGPQFRIGSFSATLNLATVGINGMDAGTAPVSGYVSVYALYNPTTKASGLLAVNTTSVAPSTICASANIPSGYTASALISIYATTATGLLKAGRQRGRSVSFIGVAGLTTSAMSSAIIGVSISSIVPMGTVSASGYLSIGSNTSTGTFNVSVYSDTYGSGQVPHAGYSAQAGAVEIESFRDVALASAQTIAYSGNVSGLSGYTFSLVITEYKF